MQEKNYFDHKEAAKRYKAGRPDFHRLVVNKLKEKLSITERYKCVLDVACGTGLLTKALLDISEKVIGVDNSEGMLKYAWQDDRITYYKGEAEHLDMIKEEVDLITVSCAFHWFKQREFLESAKDLISVGNNIIIHNNSFTSTTNDEYSETFYTWMQERYLIKFPSPSRNKFPLKEGEIEKLSFDTILNERFNNIVAMDREGLITYLITQSNVISNVEMGTYSLEEVKAWLREELSPHFKRFTSRNFIFINRLAILERKK